MKTLKALPLLLWVCGPALLFGQYFDFISGEPGMMPDAQYPEQTVQYDPGNNNLTISWQFEGAYISEIAAMGDVYQLLNISGFSKLQETGKPALPARTDRIAMPCGSEAVIEIIEFSYEDYPGFLIHPALKPARDTEGVPDPTFEKNQVVYSTDAFFPEQPVKWLDTYLVREIPIANIRTTPVLFNPVTGVIRVYSKLTFRVKFTGSKGTFGDMAKSNTRSFTQHLKNIVINSACIPDGVLPTNMTPGKSSVKNYIIITHDQYLPQVTQLASWKQQLGYGVEIVSGTGWTSSLIKSEIADRYNAWSPKPDYVLLFGDHTGAFAVPGNIRKDPFYADNFATDLYYFCMDGENDWHPDVAGGRISVSSESEAQVVVDKIIEYEKNPVEDEDFYLNGLTCAQLQDDDNNGYADRRFCHTSEEIHDYLENGQGYSTERIYYSSTTANVSGLRYNNGYYSNGQLLPSDLRSYTFDWNGGQTDITSSINQGRFLVIHRDHGYVGGSGWAHPYYTTSTMNNLANGDLLPVVLSINCHTGEYQLSNCFAEKLLRMENKGAVGVVAAAYYSFSGFNDAFAEGMIDAIWPNPGLAPIFGSGGSGNSYTCGERFTAMGNVVNQGLYAMEVNWGGDPTANRYQFELFHWFGDPAMKIWTTNPNDQAITANHTSDINCDQSAFSINNSASGATATLLFNDEIIAEAIINSSGNATFNYSIESPGSTVTLTISKEDHKPYIASLNVVGVCAFAPALNTFQAADITTEAALLSGEITGDFGSSVVESGIIYSQSPDPLINDPDVIVLQNDPVVQMGYFEHQVTGLLPETAYYFRAYALNANGTGYGNVMLFATESGGYLIPYTQNFDNGGAWPQDWTTDNPNVWSISTAWNGINNPGGYHVFSDYYPYETGSVATPVFTAEGKEGIHVKFFHYWRADYSSGSQDGYFYGSRDGGLTFPFLIDEWHHNDPGIEEGEKVYDISSWADGYEGLVFKWVVTHNNNWYWQFDDFELYETGVHGLWTGNLSTDWNDQGNWHDGILPDEYTNVVIPSVPASGNYPEINNGGGALCAELLIEADAHLYIPYDNSLTVNGTLINLAGTEGLVIQSGQGGATGSLIHDTPGVVASVEQYLTQLKWHLVGIPVQQANAGVFYLPGQSDVFLNAFIESQGNWGPWIVDVTTPLEPGRGYECWVSDNINQDETIVFQGVLNTGEFITGKNSNYSLGYTSGQGFNLMSNPFACSLEADIDTWEKNNVTNTLWAWSEEDGNYLYWNSTNISGATGFGTLSGGLIAPMQGFFVLAVGDSPQLTIPARARKHSDQVFLKGKDFVANTLKINVSGNNYRDAVFITFADSATAGFDLNYDTPKMYGYEDAPQLYTVSDDRELSINALSGVGFKSSVPMGFESNKQGQYVLEIVGFESFSENLPVILEDLLTGENIDLREHSNYTFQHFAGNEPLRFILHFGQPEQVIENESSCFSVYSSGSYIFINTEQTPLQIELFDLTGSKVWSKRITTSGSYTIAPEVSSGLYLIELSAIGVRRTFKIVLKP